MQRTDRWLHANAGNFEKNDQSIQRDVKRRKDRLLIPRSSGSGEVMKFLAYGNTRTNTEAEPPFEYKGPRWRRPHPDQCVRVAVDGDGNIWSAGVFNDHPSESPHVLKKWSPSGGLIRKIDDPSVSLAGAPPRVIDIATDVENNLIVTYLETPDFGFFGRSWLAKYDSAGNLLWSNLFTGLFQRKVIYQVETGYEGHIYTVEFPEARERVEVAKYDTDGTIIWYTDESLLNSDPEVSANYVAYGQNVSLGDNVNDLCVFHETVFHLQVPSGRSAPTSGTYTITVIQITGYATENSDTATLAFDASASDVQSALNALSLPSTPSFTVTQIGDALHQRGIFKITHPSDGTVSALFVDSSPLVGGTYATMEQRGGASLDRLHILARHVFHINPATGYTPPVLPFVPGIFASNGLIDSLPQFGGDYSTQMRFGKALYADLDAVYICDNGPNGYAPGDRLVDEAGVPPGDQRPSVASVIKYGRTDVSTHGRPLIWDTRDLPEDEPLTTGCSLLASGPDHTLYAGGVPSRINRSDGTLVWRGKQTGFTARDLASDGYGNAIVGGADASE